ncbi:hypothetical protein FQA39_LY17454 [Lamprigera yunnana]|nr:hypothetical protein FQA39_LY17454 [Lamprigera yunnana]
MARLNEKSLEHSRKSEASSDDTDSELKFKAASTLCRGWLLAMPGWQSQRGKADFGLPSTPRHSFAFSRKMSAEEDVLVALGAFIIIVENSEKVCKRRKRRFWVRPSLQSRRKYGTNIQINSIDDALTKDIRELYNKGLVTTCYVTTGYFVPI